LSYANRRGLCAINRQFSAGKYQCMDINFNNKIVAFIDVLGFKNLIDNSEVIRLQKYFEFVAEELQAYFNNNDIDYLLISDSIVIYTDYSEKHFIKLIYALGIIQARLLCSKILIRGSISQGLLFVQKSKNIIVGQGLINAYLLEKNANYPRIIIDRSFFKEGKFKKIVNTTGNKIWINLLEYESLKSGYAYIDYVHILSRYKQFLQNNRLDEVCNFIEENIYSNIYYEKYNWILKHLIIALTNSLDYLEQVIIPKAKDKKRERKKLRIGLDVLQKLKNI
jgi:hypothetical protein